MKNVYMIDTLEIGSKVRDICGCKNTSMLVNWKVALLSSALLLSVALVSFLYVERPREGLLVFGTAHTNALNNLDNENWITSMQKVGNSNLRTISFADRKHGWVGGLQARVDTYFQVSSVSKSELFSTDDGGQTWQPVGFEVSDDSYIAFVNRINKNDGLVVIQKPAVRSHQRGLQIFDTRDSGSTWTLVFDVQDFLARKFVIDQNGLGWVVGNRGIDRNASPVAAWTNDGGKTWASISTRNAPWLADVVDGPGNIEDVVVLAGQRVFLVFSNDRIIEIERSGDRWRRRQAYVSRTSGKAAMIGFDGNSPIIMQAINRSGWDLETVVHFSGPVGDGTVNLPNIFVRSTLVNGGTIAAAGSRTRQQIESSAANTTTRFEVDARVLMSNDHGRNWETIKVISGYDKTIVDRGPGTDLYIETTCAAKTCEDASTVGLNDIAWNGETYFICGNNGLIITARAMR